MPSAITLPVIDDRRRDRTASPPRPCSASSAGSCRRPRESGRAAPRAGGATADRGPWSARRGTADPDRRPARRRPRAAASGRPDSLPTQRASRFASSSTSAQHLVDAAAAGDRTSGTAAGLVDGQLVAELRLLQLDAEPLAQAAVVAAPPALAEHLDLAGVGRESALRGSRSSSSCRRRWGRAGRSTRRGAPRGRGRRRRSTSA